MAQRLIDADALIESMTKFSNAIGEDMTHGIFYAHIAPTIDAVPVKRGKWIDETFEPWGLVHHPFKCNLCGEHAEFSSPYCPNCGADMKGTEDD